MPHEFDVVCLGGGLAGEAIAVGLKDSDATDQPSTETGATMSKVEMKDFPFHFTGPRAQG